MTKLISFGQAVIGPLMLVLMLVPRIALGASAEGEDFDPVAHAADGYYLDLSPWPKIELPRIFVVRDEDGDLGFDFFWSSTAAVEVGGYSAIFDDAGDAEPGGHGDYVYATLVPSGGGHIVFDLSITRHLFFAWLSMLLVAIAFIWMGRRYAAGIGRDSAPKGRLQNLLEMMVLFVRDEIARPNLGDKTDKFLPYLLTAFFFILTSNLLGLVPFSATATSNIMVTAVLATITFLMTQFGASKDHWRHVFNPPGVPSFVKPILIPVELLGLFTKPFALAIRLFANMTAGHLIILSLIGLIFTFADLYGEVAGYGVSVVSVAFALFIYCLELLVSVIQAYVFTMLSALFIGMAVAEHDHDHDEHHAKQPAIAE